MNDIIWASSRYLWFLWIIILILPVLIFSFLKNEKAKMVFFGHSEGISIKFIFRIIFILVATVLMILGMARPVGKNKHMDRTVKTRDTLFVIDVSRSMLAEDLKPNRLEQSILAIADSMDVLSGNRVGLMAYAGTAVMLCPLTRDYSFFNNAMKNLSPGSVSRGGSMTGDAFRKIEQDILKNNPGKRLEIVLLTDGDDQESFPLEAVSSFGKYEASILVIAVGNEKEGARIPIYDENGRKKYLVYNGQEVWSVMNTKMLSKLIDMVPGSALVKVTEGAFDFSGIYKSFASSKKEKTGTVVDITQEEMYQFFLLPAFLMLCSYAFLDLFRRKQ